MSAYIVVCADGADHRDYGVGEVAVAVGERAARDAAAFMDDERDSSPWNCGPHAVRPASDPSQTSIGVDDVPADRAATPTAHKAPE